jgi:transketolase
VLLQKNWVSGTDLDSFCGDDSAFGVHPDAIVPGIDFSTGSLGQGLSMAVGAALAARFQQSSRRVFCLISDAECNEGAIWEAAMFASHHRLYGLTAVLDCNGQQAYGLTTQVLDSSNLAARWKAFGWRVTEVDGHSTKELTAALTAEESGSGRRPHLVLAKTKFGKGVSYMEDGVAVTQKHLPIQKINWHYLPMSDAEYATAMGELERSS